MCDFRNPAGRPCRTDHRHGTGHYWEADPADNHQDGNDDD